MARYIDADALAKKIYPMGIGDGRYTINAKAVKFAIDNTPTADVVPRAEVVKVFEEIERLFFKNGVFIHIRSYNKLKKKYTEGSTSE